jgi:hypothetical protein
MTVSNPAAGYSTPKKPCARCHGRPEAREALRVLALSLVQHIDDPRADLWTLGRQCEQVGLLVMQEVTGGARGRHR